MKNDLTIAVENTRELYGETGEATFYKAWKDVDREEGVRPDAKAFQAYLKLSDYDSAPQITSETSNSWTITYANLPKFDLRGNQDVYKRQAVYRASERTSRSTDDIGASTQDSPPVKASRRTRRGRTSRKTGQPSI